MYELRYFLSPLGPRLELAVLEPVMSGNKGLADVVVEEDTIRSDKTENAVDDDAFLKVGSELVGSAVCRDSTPGSAAFAGEESDFRAGTYDLARR
jgi:hypothetical protein